VLVLGEEEHFGTGRGHSTPCPLLRCVQVVCLLAKKYRSLIKPILHDLWPSSPIFDSERTVRRRLTVKTRLVASVQICMEVCNAGCLILSPMGGLLLLLVQNAEVAQMAVASVVKDVVEASLLELVLLDGVKKLHFFGLR